MPDDRDVEADIQRLPGDLPAFGEAVHQPHRPPRAPSSRKQAHRVFGRRTGMDDQWLARLGAAARMCTRKRSRCQSSSAAGMR